MKIHNKPCFSHFDEIHKFTENYFKGFNPHYFLHLRVYKSGKLYFLSSDSKIPEGHNDLQLAPSGFVQFESIESGFFHGCDDFIASTTNGPEKEHELFELHQIKNPLCMTKKFDDYYDMFLLDLHSDNASSVYINHLGFIESFFHQIKHQFSDFILKAEKDPILVTPEHLSQKNHFELQLSLKKEYNKTKSKGLSHPSILCCDNGMIKLTKKETQCLRILARGFSLKYIARCLNISPRTVETHIENMKLKASASSKESLAEIYWSNRTISSRIL